MTILLFPTLNRTNMKTLNFTEENKDCYTVLYEAVMAYPVSGIDQILKAAVIVELFQEVGEKLGETVGGFEAFKLKTVPTELKFEDAQFSYVKTCFDKAPMQTSVQIKLLAQVAKLLKSVE